MKKIVFLTGTRADFGKLKSLIQAVHDHEGFSYHLFATGMHLLDLYGKTVIEIKKAGFHNIHEADNYTEESTMDLTLAKTIESFSPYIRNLQPDLIIVHGDRVEALAGAITGALNNILVAHIEGGEISGTVDELIRHSITKLSHVHFVSNELASKRLVQMGELESSVFNIGSADLDVLFSESLPLLEQSKKYYDISFEDYAILLYHPVTTDVENKTNVNLLVQALLKSEQNYIAIFPNNDLGSKDILEAYKLFGEQRNRFKIFPSVRFEHFITLLKNAKFLIGNSSAGIHEAPFLGVPTVNIGRRQENRDIENSQIIHVDFDTKEIHQAIEFAENLQLLPKEREQEQNVATQFMEVLISNSIWEIDKQKQFRDLH